MKATQWQYEYKQGDGKGTPFVTLKGYDSFGESCVGRIVTECATAFVVNSRNPYGTHNLVLVDRDTWVAYRHGNLAVLSELINIYPRRMFVRAWKFLAERDLFWWDIHANSQ